jgi:hypothetical protein
MMLAKHLFSGFSAEIRHQNKKINEIIWVLNTGFFKPIIPRFQHSIIPADERSELRMGMI